MYIHGIYDYNCAQVIKMKTVYICQNKLGPQMYIMFIKNENFFIRNVSGKLTFKKSNKCSKAKAHKSLLQIFSQTFLDYATHLAFMHLCKNHEFVFARFQGTTATLFPICIDKKSFFIRIHYCV